MKKRTTASRFNPARLADAVSGLTREQVAVAVGKSEGTVRNWLAGRGEPDASDIAAIAALTGHALEFFFGGEAA